MKPKSADGVEGVLIQVGAGVYKFRVYDSEHNFVDYDLHHSDLCVTIDDTDAYFYDTEFSSILDHAPMTLGIKDDS